MSKTRLFTAVIGPILVLVAIGGFQAFRPSVGVQESAYSSIGRGEYQRYEAQLTIPNAWLLESSRSYAGIGDLRVLEAQPSLPNTGALESDPPYTGRGDFLLYEEQLSIPSIGAPKSSPAYAGMGDLRLTEARQSLAKAEPLESNRIGMGDLLALEALFSQPNTGVLGSSRLDATMGDLQNYVAKQLAKEKATPLSLTPAQNFHLNDGR